MKICKVEGCNGKHKAKGYCDKHYKQFQRGTLGEEGQEIVIVQGTKEETVQNKGQETIIVQETIRDTGQEVVICNTRDKGTQNKPKLPKIPKPAKKPTKKLSDEELYKKLILDSFPDLLEDDSESLEEHYYKHHNTSWLFANGIDRDEFITWQIKTCDGMLRDKVPFPQVKCSINIRITKEID